MIRILLSTRLGERRWTQAQLSRMTGVRAATISELYNEIAEKISFSDLWKICKALNCTPADLLVMEDKPDIEAGEDS